MVTKRKIFIGIILTTILTFVLFATYVTVKKFVTSAAVQTSKQYISYLTGKVDEWVFLMGENASFPSDKTIDFILSQNTMHNGYTFLIDEKGVIIAHPNYESLTSYKSSDLINISDVYSNIFDLQNPNDSYFIATDFDGISRIFIAHVLTSNDLILCLAIPWSDVASVYLNILSWLLPIAGSATILLFLVILYAMGRNQLKRSKDALKQTQALYLKAIANSNTVLFDYDVKSKQIVYSSKLAKRHGFLEFMSDVPKSLIATNIIHNEDVPAIKNLFHAIDRGRNTAECTVRMREIHNSIVWYNIVMTNSFNKLGLPTRAVGVVRDITCEKQAEISLLKKVERDHMTGVYNKSSGIKLIKEILDTSNVNSVHTLFVLDVDNFKSINDNLGHAMGDNVIIDVARALISIFRKTDIICRFGGDEFVIFTKSLDNISLIHKKAENICNALRRGYGKGVNSVNISASIGIACFPAHGLTYSELFEHADCALYVSKQKGKDSYTVYSEEDIVSFDTKDIRLTY